MHLGEGTRCFATSVIWLLSKFAFAGADDVLRGKKSIVSPFAWPEETDTEISMRLFNEK